MWLCFIFIIFVFPIETIKQSLEQKENAFSLFPLWRLVCKHMSSQEFEVDGGDAVDLHPLSLSNQQLCFPSSLYAAALQPLKMTTLLWFSAGVCVECRSPSYINKITSKTSWKEVIIFIKIFSPSDELHCLVYLLVKHFKRDKNKIKLSKTFLVFLFLQPLQAQRLCCENILVQSAV